MEKQKIPDMKWNTQTLLEDNGMAATPALAKPDIEKLMFGKMDKQESVYKYHIVDTIAANDDLLLLLGREYPEENRAWLAKYNNNMLVDFVEVFYENAEGSHSIVSEIKDEQLLITEENEYEELGPAKEVRTYDINVPGKFKLLKKAVISVKTMNF